MYLDSRVKLERALNWIVLLLDAGATGSVGR